MIAFFANIFGYVLNFLYEKVGNFGLAIILFSILVKVIMIPISIKQQKTLKASQKIQEEMKQIQFKYKNDPEKLNQETIALYKRENMSPFSGCFSAIAQLILLFAVFYLVRSPLTYMRKVEPEIIQKTEAIVQEEGKSSNYKEIAIINYINSLKTGVSVREETEDDEFKINDYIDELYINMDFLGVDLSKVPTEDLTDIKVLIIPILYVISSFISIKMTNSMTSNKNKKNNLLGDGLEQQKEEYNPMEEANKSMSWFMPIMSISIACIAPLGLALYWLMNNILMIFERIILDKFLKNDNKEANGDA